MSHQFEIMTAVSALVWDQKYRDKHVDGAPIDQTVEDTFKRVARNVAAIEPTYSRDCWSETFFEMMRTFEFIPGGRILAAAGTDRPTTDFSCFVMGRIDDHLGSIFDNLKEAALTMQQGGGIGHDFSTLRPKGVPLDRRGGNATGPVSFMHVWDQMCDTIVSAGSRPGAMMATLRCDHPDIHTFVEAKSDSLRLRNFNLSVLVTDEFINAVKEDMKWRLVFEGKTYRTVDARDLWQNIMRAAYEYAEPGVIFIDRVNARNNLRYCEDVRASNPCGEQMLPEYGACLLGSINLARTVREPFTSAAQIDEERLAQIVGYAVRFLDNVIDVSNYPLEQQRREASSKRRIGLGITGLADALVFCGARYGSPASVELTKRWLSLIKRSAYSASANLARERGPFPLFNKDSFLQAPNVTTLDATIKHSIATDGIRNGLLTSIAPTGTTSILAGNVSSGIEPIFGLEYARRFRAISGEVTEELVQDYAYRLFIHKRDSVEELPGAFVTVDDLTPSDHLSIAAAAQEHVDNAISKTINCPESISYEDFEAVYMTAYDLGLKGCTAFRPNAITGSVLERLRASED